MLIIEQVSKEALCLPLISSSDAESYLIQMRFFSVLLVGMKERPSEDSQEHCPELSVSLFLDLWLPFDSISFPNLRIRC